ncbi:hypothetical protein QOZ80_1BG0077330 [Eleusine coracana subsp. coracana]|nr:hypothetical protein QOZ80_1BG0077330 [Eleusine coracana subsp. coracana]
MAGSSDDQRRRHADDMDEELEEGEIVPGQGYHSESDTEEYYNHYSSSESDDDDEATSKTRWYLVATRTGEASCPSSVVDGRYYGAIKPSCRVCGKEFTSSKAVCGHMKVHALERQQEQGKNNGNKEQQVKEVVNKRTTVSLAMGWGGTGKRGCSGARSSSSSRSASPDSSEPENAMPVVADEGPKLVLEPTPLSYSAANLPSSVPVASAETQISGEAISNNNAQPMHDDAMAIVVVAGGADDPPPPTEAVVVVHHQPAALLPTGTGFQAPPSVHRHRAAAGTQNPVGYTCAECGKQYPTNQALGGHVAGHRNRRVAAAAVGHQDGAGVQQLQGEGGEGARLQELRLGLPFDAAPAPAAERGQPAPAPAEGAVEAVRPAPGPNATGRVILFGIDIGPGVQRPRTPGGSPGTKGSAADIGGQQ